MCNNNNEIKAKEFFIFSYFNIVPECIFDSKEENNEKFSEFNNYKEYVAYKCAYRAYRDLNRTLTVNKDNSEKERKEIVHGICNKIIINIKALFNQTCDKDFNNEHHEICKKLIECVNDESNLLKSLESETNIFSYGQAQKWINMTLKYMWLLGFLENKIKTEYLHVPVDSYIIKAVWEKENITLPIVKKLKNGSRGAYSSEKVKSWSKWDYDDYKEFQRSLKDALGNENRIEWEHSAWIEFAE